MNKRLVLLMLPLMILAAVFAGSGFVPNVHAAVGLVCLADPSTAPAPPANPCPATPYIFGGPGPNPALQVSPTQIRIGVFISGSDALNGFDVTLLANSAILRPAGVDLTGSILPAGSTVIVLCLQGVLKTGSTCAATDTIDTLHFAAVGPGGFISTPPTSGLLFTAIYDIVGTTAAGGISVGYQTGCGSATSSPPICVTIANGSITADMETTQAATFDNSTPSSWISVIASPTTATVGAPNTPVTITLTYTPQGGWPNLNTCPCVVPLSFVADPGLSVTGLPASISINTAPVTVTFTISAATAGTYHVTVYATYTNLDGSSFLVDTLVAPVTVTLTVQDFSVAISPTPVIFPPGGSATSTLTIKSLSGFTGSCTISASINSPATPVLTITFNPTTFTLPAGGTVTSIVTFTTPAGTPVGTLWHVQLRVVCGSVTHTTALFSVFANDFTMTANPTTVTFATGSSGTSTLTLTSLGGTVNGFAGPVTLTFSTTPATGLTVSCVPNPVSLTAGGTATSTCTFSGSPGTYTVIITGTGGTGGSIVHSVTITVIITGGVASPTIATIIKDSTNTAVTTVAAGTAVHDTAIISGGSTSGVTGTVTYTLFSFAALPSASVPCSGGTIVGTAQTVTIVSGVVPDATAVTLAPGFYGYSAVYNGDANNNPATSNCEPLTVGKASPAITTVIKNGSGTAVTSVTVGTAVHDTATLSGATATAGGTVTYTLFTNGACTGTGTVVSTVTVTNGVVPDSAAVTPTPAGSYSFIASYSGDANNAVATSACEPFTVNKTTPTLATTVSALTSTVGTPVHDSATLTNSFQAGGTVTYTLFTNGACTGTGTLVSTVTVTGGVVPDSAAVTPTPAGSYSFSASYSGDANNAAATSACEPFTVNKTTPTITTTVSATSVTVGTPVHDSATLTSSFQAGGTVTYTLFPNGACTGTVNFGVSTVTVTNGIVPDSAAFTPTPAGSYSFIAVYSGDANNAAATSACEPFTVNKATPSITSTVTPSSITIGQSATDLATLTGSFTPTGTVTYTVFSAPTSCVGTPLFTSTVPLGSSSAAFTPAAPGTYQWIASYSGDVNNNAVATVCGAEPLTVNKATPTLATTVSAVSSTVGTPVHDSATLTNSFQAGGTVTYTLFTNGACTGTGTVVSTVTVTNGIVPDSAAVTPTPAGSYSFIASYSGDANNAVATSACEPFTINKTTPTLTTTVSATSVTVGTAVHDSATLSGGFQASGTVTYTLFSNGACTGTGSTVSTVTVTAGVVPDSTSVTPTPAGPYAFRATYSGDANNAAATSACEPFTVNQATPTISTTVSALTSTVGTAVHDSSTIAGGFQPSGTVTYTLFTNGLCTGTGTVVGSPVAVTNGVVPDSASVTPTPAGSYAFRATYSGDANNVAATSACEPFTVNKTTPTLTTTVSATSVTVGTAVHDSAALTSSFQAGGTVTYTLFSNGACTGTGTVVSTVTVTAGIVPDSAAVTPTPAGSYSFSASYSGDANNAAATSACEPFTVNKITPAIASTVTPSTITIGQSATDLASVTGGFTPTGTVTYTVFSTTGCTGTPVFTSTVALGASSAAFTPAAPGTYQWIASYSGDANNNPVATACGAEPLVVNKASPTLATTVSALTSTVGTPVHDSATLTNSFQAGGTVTYTLFTNGACTGTGTIVSTVTVTGGVVPDSAAVTPTPAGSYSFSASYSGDANNAAATSACEPFTVNKASPILATTVSATSVAVGTAVHDSATLTGGFQASGTVTYTLFTNGACTGTGTTVSTVTVTGGVVPDSTSVTPTPAGSYAFRATYSGDANNAAATSACEPFTVNKASPTIATTLSATTITVGSAVSDSSILTGAFQASGTVTYQFFTGSTCTGTATTVGTPVTVTGGSVPSSASQTFTLAGPYSWWAIYSGDANNNGATSPCEPLTVNKATPTITTTVSALVSTVGTPVHDSATLTNSFQAGGTVTYTLFTNGACTGTGTIVSTVTVTNGVVPDSAAVTPTPAGSYSFSASYSGDANNAAATSACEPFTVNKVPPTITTSVSALTSTVGTPVHDSATLTNSFQAGGTVTYTLFSNSACTGTGTVVSTVTVTSGVVPNSASVTPTPAGSYSFIASYSGDANNVAATSACEPFTVTKATPSITSTVTPATITIGQSATDLASVTGGFTPTGTVTYTVFSNPTCTGTPVFTSTVPLGTASAAFTPAAPGTYQWIATYNGDANNNPVSTTCGAEPLTVNQATPTLTTTVSATSVTVGTAVHDSATLTGGFQASGTVTYTLFTNGTCTGTGTTVSTVTVTGGVVPDSTSVTPTPAGSYAFRAAYSGDANNAAATSACEPFTVNKASPTLATTVSALTSTVGTPVHDSSALTNAFQAGGTVTYTLFSNGACTGTGTLVSTVTVLNGVVPDSASVTPTPAGSYSFIASYSGDANNLAATSACEPFTVSKTTPTITTTVSATSVTVGTPVHDSAALTNSFQAGGTVTYTLFTNGACTGTGTIVSTVTVTGGVVPDSAAVTPTPAGSYSFIASYSGDANNLAATSACEPFTVNKATPTLTTTLTSSTITVGQSVTDSATLSSFFQAGGTVTYVLFTNSGCSGTSSIISIVTVTNGVIPNSRAVIFNATGSYAFQAIYSGDANNAAATSPCEPLQVNPVTGVSISTTLSATTVVVGGSVFDTAALTGTTATAGGTVTYNLFTTGTCTGTSTIVSTVTVTNGVVPNSASHTFTAAGAYSWTATYSGDANNAAAQSGCETMTVSKASPTIATTVSATSVTVGIPVHDSATLTGGFQPVGGTVTYTLFTNGLCTGTGTVVSTVTVTNGIVPDSAAVTPTPAGSYAFQASYSGDTNNNGALSPCEPFTVNKASPTLTTTVSATSVPVGTAVHDSAVLTGGFSAGGTVTYTLFSNGACTGTGSTVSTVTVTNGVVPDSTSVTPTPAGAYAFRASYSGDANNNAIVSACEPFTVNKATPTISTTVSALTSTVGTAVHDSAALAGGFQPGGTVTYTLFTNGLCTGTGTIVGSPVTVTNGVVPDSASVTPTPAGSYAFQALYSGDANNVAATSACEPFTVNKATPTITTTVSALTSTVGTPVHDSATLTNSFQAGGTVTYTLFSNGACTGTGTIVSTVTVTAGVVPDSAAVTPTPAGSYSFSASYSGDANNAAATSACEPFTVNKATPTITTTLSSTSVQVGGSVFDTATLSSSFQAGGTVTYVLFTNGTCTGTSSVVSIVTVTNNVVPNSRAVVFNATGPYSFQAIYSGDANNLAATSACEPLTVTTIQPTITTALSATTITVGGSVFDSATLTSVTATAGGTVTYNLFTTGTCTGTATIVSTVTVTNGIVPNSASHTFTTAGSYSWNAVYSGDANNAGATSACEPLTVNQATPTITTTVSATTITVGMAVHDSATLTSSFQAGGTVTYNLFTNGLCTGTSTVVSTATVTNGVVPDSASITPAAGSYAFQAVYSGDVNNKAATSACEPFTVSKASPLIATTVSNLNPTVGTPVHDSATLTGGFQPTGTVTYTLFSNGACTGTGTLVSTVTVTNGVVPDSASVTPTPAGSYSFIASYSGDANNNAIVSACEPFTVMKASPSLTTTLSATTITVGGSVTDSATLAGATATAGGTVTYTLFTTGTCTGTGTVVSIVPVTNGVVPNSRSVVFNATGAYSFIASYSGDANNAAATSPCEPLTVGMASPTITTTLSSTSIAVGGSVTDSATLANAFRATGTVTYVLFTNGTCTGTSTVVSTVTVTNGIVPNSRAVTFNATGTYAFRASYSGDANNNPATSACEPLTVTALASSITTTLSATTITVGGTVHDSATLSGVTATAGGTVTYNLFTNGLCTGTSTVVSVVTVTNGIVPNSRDVIFNSTGVFAFNAVYSGDANNSGATSACEPLTVNKASPTLTTTVSATSVTVGTPVHDSATLAGAYKATGTVTYTLFSNGTCTGTGSTVSTVTVTNGVVPDSTSVTPTPAGSYAFQATYSGDANNNGIVSACEPFAVNKASPTIATTVSATSVVAGTPVHDSATLANAFQAGGTVTYVLFSNSACTGTSTIVSTVTVTNGVVPDSASVTPVAGSYAFQATYSGDANNLAATSPCEPFTVTGAPDFTITANPTSVTVNAGTAGSSTITITPINGFTGTVTLTVNNAACTVTPSTISGGSGTASLSCTFTTAGTYIVTVTGTSGTLSHSVTVTFIVQDFTITASPSALTIPAGGTGLSSISITAVNGFAGTVALTATAPPGLTATLNPTSVVDSGSSTLTITVASTVAPGTYVITITGTSGSLTHTTTVTVTVVRPDFMISANPTSVSANVGTAASSTITITPVNGFTGTVTLTFSISPATGLTCTLTPTTITGGSGTSTLSCTGTVAGTYTVTVTGTSGALTHSTTVTYTIVSQPTAQNPQIFQLRYTHKLSFASTGGLEKFTVGVYNPNSATTLYFYITITAVSDTGTTTYTSTSAVYAIAPHGQVCCILIPMQFKPSDIGHTFSFTVTIHWGTSPTSQPFISHDISNIGIEDFDEDNSANGTIIVVA